VRRSDPKLLGHDGPFLVDTSAARPYSGSRGARYPLAARHDAARQPPDLGLTDLWASEGLPPRNDPAAADPVPAAFAIVRGVEHAWGSRGAGPCLPAAVAIAAEAGG
jgi:hypothetical protein